MQSTSALFYVFFAAVFALYWALPAQKRWAAALAASVGFYASFGLPSLAVLALCTAGSFLGGGFLQRHKTKRALALCLAAALLPLVFFKYFNTVYKVFSPDPAFSLFLPVGISFFTFKIIAYLIEVWRGGVAAQAHFGRYALYVAFFPEVTSGPIQRPADLLGQLEAPRSFDSAQALQAAQLILWGLFQKLVIADNLAGYVKNGFGKPDLVMGMSLMAAAVLYAVQLYADFAGYSHIAIGCMGLLGFSVPANFLSPYFSRSIKEFWAQWHISLSTFLRDYVYFPLGGSRCGTLRRCMNLLLTFLLSGLWHGTGLQFLVWGLLHGVYQVCGVLTQPLRRKAWAAAHISEDGAFARCMKTLCTFLLVTIAWVFFGAESLPAALHLFARMPDSFALSLQAVKNAFAMLGFTPLMLGRMAVCIGAMAWIDLRAKDCGFSAWLAAHRGAVQVVLCYALALAVLFWAPASGGSFIYFQF